MSRFFKKSRNINAITDREIDEFLRKENLVGKIEMTRVKDFYNGLSTMASQGKIVKEDEVDYKENFNATTKDDISAIDKMREQEYEYINSINKDLITNSRLLKAAAALAYKFEKDRYNGPGDASGCNSYLRNLLSYSEDKENSKSMSFSDMLDEDLTFMKYLALLSSKSAFSVDHGKLEKSSSGKIVKYKPMETMSDAINMDLIQCVMPDFNKKLVTEELYTRQRFIRTAKAQNLIILIDDSGSMNDYSKKCMLNAALTIKLRDHSDCHNIYVGTFEKRIYGFVKVEKDMKRSDLNKIYLDKNMTDVNGCIKDTVTNISKRSLPDYYGGQLKLDNSHFEIMVINDGSDRVDPTYHPQIKIHALCLMQSNRELKNICHRSGGTYNYLHGTD